MVRKKGTDRKIKRLVPVHEQERIAAEKIFSGIKGLYDGVRKNSPEFDARFRARIERDRRRSRRRDRVLTTGRLLQLIDWAVENIETLNDRKWEHLRDSLVRARANEAQNSAIGTLIKKSEGRTRIRAIALANYVSDASNMDALMTCMREKRGLEEIEATAWAIGAVCERTKDKGIFERYGQELAELLLHPSSVIRQETAWALMHIGDKRVLEALEEALEREGNEEAKKVMGEAVEKLRGS